MLQRMDKQARKWQLRPAQERTWAHDSMSAGMGLPAVA